MDGCLFCKSEIINQGILDETQNFYHRANMVGAVAPGHSMIIPKTHFGCYAEIPSSLDEEYLDFKNIVEERVSKAFSKPIMVEQGIHAQSVSHAHTHFLPSISEWYNFQNGTSFMDMLPDGIKVTKCSSLEDLRKIFREEGQYVSIEEQGVLYACHTKEYASLLRPCREFPCKLTGLTSLLYWEKMSEEDKNKNKDYIAETFKKLKQGV